MIAIDFETYYDDECSVGILGCVPYVHHERFHTLLVSIMGDVGGEHIEYVGPVEEAPWGKIDGVPWVAHHAAFEAAIVYFHLPTLGIKSRPSKWIDSSHLSVYNGHPRSLKGAALAILGVDLDKQIRADAKGKCTKHFSAEEWSDFCKYCLDDSRYSLEIAKKVTMPEQFHGLSNWVIEMEMRGINIDMDSVEHHLMRLEELGRTEVARLPWGKEILDAVEGSIFDHTAVTTTAAPSTIEARSQGVPKHRISRTKAGYRITSVPAITSLVELRNHLTHNFKGKLPTSFNKAQPAFQRFYAKYHKEVPELEAFIQFKEINKVYNDLNKLKNLSVDGVYHGSLSFFGAHTGRFSGRNTAEGGGGKRGKFNLQNITNGSKFGVCMRDLLIAPEGKRFFTADLAQIEARLVAYYAKDQETLRLVASGQSIYEVHARLNLGYDGESPLKKIDPVLYKRAKAEVLSLGYGQGLSKYFDRNRDTFATLEEAEVSFNDYRENKKDVRRVWRLLDKRIAKAAQESEYYVKRKYGFDMSSVFGSDDAELKSKITDDLIKNKIGVVKVRVHGERDMIYRATVGVKKMMPWGRMGCEYTTVFGHGRRSYVYGAMLLENLCQAAASDILHKKLVQLEQAGIDCRLVVHDEIDGYIKDYTDIHLIGEIMEAPDPLFEGLPIGCEINVGKTFSAGTFVFPDVPIPKSGKIEIRKPVST